jgi:hypothetical protein
MKKIKPAKIRNKQITRKRLINAVGNLLARQGFKGIEVGKDYRIPLV